MELDEFKTMWSGDYEEAFKYCEGEVTIGIKALVVVSGNENHEKFIEELQDLLNKYAI